MVAANVFSSVKFTMSLWWIDFLNIFIYCHVKIKKLSNWMNQWLKQNQTISRHSAFDKPESVANQIVTIGMENKKGREEVCLRLPSLTVRVVSLLNAIDMPFLRNSQKGIKEKYLGVRGLLCASPGFLLHFQLVLLRLTLQNIQVQKIYQS